MPSLIPHLQLRNGARFRGRSSFLSCSSNSQLEAATLLRSQIRPNCGAHARFLMTSPSSQSISRSADFWFDDGNLILQVETAQFRIHRGLICANSVVFRDMHALSQPEERGAIDGCPVVQLQGDTEADWTNLLEYIYFPAR